MPRRVKGPDGIVHNFPDDATDQEISRALGAIPQTNQQQVPTAKTWTDTAIDALPMVGGAIGGLMAAPGLVTSVGGAALGGMAGEAAKQNINMLRGKGVPTAGGAAKDIALSGAFQGGGQAAGVGLIRGAQAVAPRLMQSALKPAQSLLDEYRTTAPDLAKVLLNEGASVTSGGLRKLQSLLKATNDEIKALVQSSKATISKDAVLGRVDKLAMESMKTSANPTKALAKATQVADEFVEHPYYKGDTLPVSAAQALKVGSYKEIGNAYGKPEKAQALKALARGLKEEIATAVPGVAELNARDAQLMGALDAVGRRVAQASNRDPVGFAWAASDNPKAFLAALIDRSPAVKSMLARGLWRSAAKATGVEPQVIAGAVRALVSEDEK